MGGPSPSPAPPQPPSPRPHQGVGVGPPTPTQLSTSPFPIPRVPHRAPTPTHPTPTGPHAGPAPPLRARAALAGHNLAEFYCNGLCTRDIGETSARPTRDVRETSGLIRILGQKNRKCEITSQRRRDGSGQPYNPGTCWGRRCSWYRCPGPARARWRGISDFWFSGERENKR